MAHAVWGAVAAQMSGGNAAAGAAGAFSGELATRFIAEAFYHASTPEEIARLSQADKEQLSLLGTIAAGAAGAVAGNSSAAATTGALAGKNAVENNSLSVMQARSLIEEQAKCQTDTECRQSVTEKYAKLNKEQHLSVEQCDSAKECVAKANEMGKLQTEYANRLSELVDKSRAGGLDEKESQEWIYLNSVLPTLEMDRGTAIKRALASGESAEAKQLAINSIAQAGAAGAAGIVGGTGKVRNKPESSTNQVITKNIDPNILISRQNKNEMSGSQVKRLVKDMKANGFDVNEPIDAAIVNGKVIIIDGHHRAEAAAKAGIKDVPVRIHDVTTEQGDQLLREAAEARLRY